MIKVSVVLAHYAGIMFVIIFLGHWYISVYHSFLNFFLPDEDSPTCLSNYSSITLDRIPTGYISFSNTQY